MAGVGCSVMILVRSESYPGSASTDVETGISNFTRQASDPVTSVEIENAKERVTGEPYVPIVLPGSMHEKNMTESSKFIKIFNSYSLSRKIQNSVVETFLCAICGENESNSNSFVTKSCPHQHRYCVTCMKHWINSLINDGTTILHCPDASCVKSLKSSILDSDEVKLLATAEVFNKYIRYKNVQGNEHYRECPTCGTSVIHESVNPEIVCVNCSAKYCFMHGNAHLNTTCDDYARKINQELKASTALINRITKQCPQCKAPTEKNNGCNHITCKICQTNWCWICGRDMVDVTSHYSQNTRDGCPGLQFTDPGCNCRYLFWQYCLSHCRRILPCCWCDFIMYLPNTLMELILLVPLMLCRTVALSGVVVGLLITIVYWVPKFIVAVRNEPDAEKDFKFFFDTFVRTFDSELTFFSLSSVSLAILPLALAWLPIGFIICTVIVLYRHFNNERVTDDDVWPYLFLPLLLFYLFFSDDDS